MCGPWTREKLAYLERYAAAFTRAMRGKWSQLVYMDFLAGPGIGIERHSRVEFDGSPLVALKVRPAFDQLFFSDADARNVAALRQRIPAADRARAFVETGECHDVAARVVARLPAQALALAFVDPEGFEVTFKMFQILARKRVDVLYLFPGGIGVARNVGNFVRQARAPLDDLIPGWRKLKRARLAAGQRLTDEEMAARDQPFVMEFMSRMQTLGFQFSDRGEPYFTNQKNVKMYHLLFFSQHPTGLGLWRRITRIEASGQRRLPL
ncbi:MAG TPA: three-Cys-motif partner protein TcmP [Candidatus Binatia bacterium]|nr:three-Cys-motif partner protein TcmP [Candidatus Binatia bacterium]